MVLSCIYDNEIEKMLTLVWLLCVLQHKSATHQKYMTQKYIFFQNFFYSFSYFIPHKISLPPLALPQEQTETKTHPCVCRMCINSNTMVCAMQASSSITLLSLHRPAELSDIFVRGFDFL